MASSAVCAFQRAIALRYSSTSLLEARAAWNRYVMSPGSWGLTILLIKSFSLITPTISLYLFTTGKAEILFSIIRRATSLTVVSGDTEIISVFITSLAKIFSLAFASIKKNLLLNQKTALITKRDKLKLYFIITFYKNPVNQILRYIKTARNSIACQKQCFIRCYATFLCSFHF